MKTIEQKRNDLNSIGYLTENMSNEMIEKFYPNFKKSNQNQELKEKKQIFKSLAKLNLV